MLTENLTILLIGFIQHKNKFSANIRTKIIQLVLRNDRSKIYVGTIDIPYIFRYSVLIKSNFFNYLQIPNKVYKYIYIEMLRSSHNLKRYNYWTLPIDVTIAELFFQLLRE